MLQLLYTFSCSAADLGGSLAIFIHPSIIVKVHFFFHKNPFPESFSLVIASENLSALFLFSLPLSAEDSPFQEELLTALTVCLAL